MELSLFEQCALVSGLAKDADLLSARKEIMTGIQPAPEEIPGRLADVLVNRGILNRWQAQQLLAGRIRFTLGNYRIFDSIGHGGMGQVFKARHEITGVVYAIKVLPREKATQSAIENFQHEIQNMANLSHPNLVRAVDAGMDGNVYYMVTEYVPGPDLRKLVRSHGPLTQEMAASVIVQTAQGLSYAHRMGLVHRDVKPGNILVAMNGVAKLSDMGLASSATREKSTKIVGTADYISPDQVRNPLAPQPIWDIYSLGCTLYYIVTAQVPYPKGSSSDKVKLHLDANAYPVNPCSLNPMISEEFADVMACMMAKNPAERIPTALEVIQFLSPWSDGTPVPIRETDVDISPSGSFQRSDLGEFLPQVSSIAKNIVAQEKSAASEPLSKPNQGKSSDAGIRPLVQIEEDVSPNSQQIPSLLLVDDLQDPDDSSNQEGNATVTTSKRGVVPPPVPPAAPSSTIRKAFILDTSDDSNVDLGNFEVPEEPARNVDSVLNRFKKNAMNFFKKK
ncbi:MAG: serine/threonine-protein kinase [Thermoguttaceae bacterium]|nr:serine/threonine-protein kinase [Thermoguttaceae bacterium]